MMRRRVSRDLRHFSGCASHNAAYSPPNIIARHLLTPPPFYSRRQKGKRVNHCLTDWLVGAYAVWALGCLNRCLDSWNTLLPISLTDYSLYTGLYIDTSKNLSNIQLPRASYTQCPANLLIASVGRHEVARNLRSVPALIRFLLVRAWNVFLTTVR